MTKIYLGGDEFDIILDSGKKLTLTAEELNDLNENRVEQEELEDLNNTLKLVFENANTIEKELDNIIDKLNSNDDDICLSKEIDLIKESNDTILSMTI